MERDWRPSKKLTQGVQLGRVQILALFMAGVCFLGSAAAVALLVRHFIG